jgi:hypothetical protein
MKIKELPNKFSKSGFDYELLRRVGNVALLEKTRAGDKLIVSYEIVVIRAHGGYTIAGSTVEPAEYIPKSEDWGTYGWTQTTEDLAYAKFAEISKQDWTYMTNVAGAKVVEKEAKERKPRNHKSSGFEVKFPSGEFSMNDLAELNGKTSSYIYTFMKQNGIFSKIKEVREERGGRGKPRKIYVAA